jgi:hypothetical protein
VCSSSSTTKPQHDSEREIKQHALKRADSITKISIRVK